VLDIQEANLKDVALIELQEWGISQCGWKRPEEPTAPTVPADNAETTRLLTAKE
jgi:hypothetical protein